MPQGCFTRGRRKKESAKEIKGDRLVRDDGLKSGPIRKATKEERREVEMQILFIEGVALFHLNARS